MNPLSETLKRPWVLCVENLTASGWGVYVTLQKGCSFEPEWTSRIRKFSTMGEACRGTAICRDGRSGLLILPEPRCERSGEASR